MNDDRALAYLKMMGYDDSKAREMLTSPIGELHKGILNEMEFCIKSLAGEDNVDPIKVFQKVKGKF